jgi:hypothetical protein
MKHQRLLPYFAYAPVTTIVAIVVPAAVAYEIAGPAPLLIPARRRIFRRRR